MDGFFIQQTAPNVYGPSSYRPDLLDYSQEALLADNWYPLIVNLCPQHDINKIQVTTYELRDGVVHQIHTLIDKEGEELNKAIVNKWNLVRFQRDEIIQKSDWTQLPDAKITDEKKASWANYRQALRDITTQSDPFSITWPTDPNGQNGQIGVIRV